MAQAWVRGCTDREAKALRHALTHCPRHSQGSGDTGDGCLGNSPPPRLVPMSVGFSTGDFKEPSPERAQLLEGHPLTSTGGRLREREACEGAPLHHSPARHHLTPNGHGLYWTISPTLPGARPCVQALGEHCLGTRQAWTARGFSR